MLIPCPTLSLLTVIMSLIRSALELQNIHSLAGPFNCDRVRTPSPKDNLIVGVYFIPITYSVIILFLVGATVLRVPYICSCTLKKLFCFSSEQLLFPHLPTEGCRQSLSLPTTVALWYSLGLTQCVCRHHGTSDSRNYIFDAGSSI